MRLIAKTALLLVLASTASVSLGDTTPEAAATPASGASLPAPQETSRSSGTTSSASASASSGGNLLTNIYKLAKGLGLTRCVPYALPLVTTLPRLPAGLVNNDLIGQALGQTALPLSAVCDFSVTGAVGPVYTGFLPAWYSWHHAHIETISSILQKCPAATALVNTVEAYESCSQVQAVMATATVGGSTGGGEGATATATATTTTAGTDAPETTGSASDAAALKDTCLAIAPAAAVGLVGLVVAL
ncbi:hypothetical protein SLS62_010159 [Diatrype stigma]|uniref:Infection structure specific protein n=1 Tax=Diatrype stigma TaxID=117547 RepID=A0AAN9UHQ3_9PEZI